MQSEKVQNKGGDSKGEAPKKKRKLSFSFSKKNPEPKARWGKAISGVRAVGKVTLFFSLFFIY